MGSLLFRGGVGMGECYMGCACLVRLTALAFPFVLVSSFNIQTGWRTKHLEKDQYLVFTNPIKKIDKMTQ